MLNNKKVAAIINGESLEDEEFFKENLKFPSELQAKTKKLYRKKLLN